MKHYTGISVLSVRKFETNTSRIIIMIIIIISIIIIIISIM